MAAVFCLPESRALLLVFGKPSPSSWPDLNLGTNLTQWLRCFDEYCTIVPCPYKFTVKDCIRLDNGSGPSK